MHETCAFTRTDYLRVAAQSLPEAVATCVDAAQADLYEPRQIALMKVLLPCFWLPSQDVKLEARWTGARCASVCIKSINARRVFSSPAFSNRAKDSVCSTSFALLFRVFWTSVLRASSWCFRKLRDSDRPHSKFPLVMRLVVVQAACYGRAFCSAESFPKDRIVTVCRQLRILNALRQPEVGLPLTASQAEALTLPVVVSRLINARRHWLALQISSLLGMGPEKVTRQPTS